MDSGLTGFLYCLGGADTAAHQGGLGHLPVRSLPLDRHCQVGDNMIIIKGQCREIII